MSLSGHDTLAHILELIEVVSAVHMTRYMDHSETAHSWDDSASLAPSNSASQYGAYNLPPIPTSGRERSPTDLDRVIKRARMDIALTSDLDGGLCSQSLISSGTPLNSAPYNPRKSATPSSALMFSPGNEAIGGEDLVSSTSEDVARSSAEVVWFMHIYEVAHKSVLANIANERAAIQSNAEQARGNLQIPNLSDDQREEATRLAFAYHTNPTQSQIGELIQAEIDRIMNDMRACGLPQFVNSPSNSSIPYVSPPHRPSNAFSRPHRKVTSQLYSATSRAGPGPGSPSLIPSATSPSVSSARVFEWVDHQVSGHCPFSSNV